MTDTPLFDATAGDDAEHVEALLTATVPTAAELLAQYPREGGRTHECGWDYDPRCDGCHCAASDAGEPTP